MQTISITCDRCRNEFFKGKSLKYDLSLRGDTSYNGHAQDDIEIYGIDLCLSCAKEMKKFIIYAMKANFNL